MDRQPDEIDKEKDPGAGAIREDEATQTLAGLRVRSESRSGSRDGASSSNIRRPPTPAAHDGPATIGRFLILDQIAAGGMGELYLGWDGQLDRKVAIKLVRTRQRSELTEQRLRREAKVLAQLSHPNVVPVFDVGELDGRVFIAMEFVEGRTLRTWIAELELRGAERVAAIVRCFVSAGRGLEAVHAAGLAHRDFKPENVIVGGDGRVRIVDFGLARALDEGDDSTHDHLDAASPSSIASDDEALGPAEDGDSSRSMAALTETGALLGTPRYMAPEQWRGLRGDSRSDQFSFCVALFEALFERRPFEAPDLDALADAVKRGIVSVPQRRSDIPHRIREALLRGLAPDPASRFESMTELLDELVPRPVNRRPLVLAILGVSMILTLTVIWLAWFGPRREVETGGESTLASLRREVAAREHLERVDAQVEALGEAGKHEDADAIFAAFAQLPDHAGTLALGRGWLAQARRLEQRGQLDAELDAYAAAYLSSASTVQRDALLGLARVFARTRQWQRLAGTLDAIEARQPTLEPGQTEALRAMRVAALASQRDLVGAAQVLEPVGGQPLTGEHATLLAAIRQLSRTSTTEHVVIGTNLQTFALPGVDLDGDEVGELLVIREGESSVAVLGTAEPDLPLLAQLELEGGPSQIAPADLQVLRDPGDSLISLRQGQRSSLHRVVAELGQPLALDRLVEVEQAGEQSASWTIGDLDGDGRREAYIGDKPGRTIVALEPGPGSSSWRRKDPHLPTTAASSVIHVVVDGDVDGDGTPELAVLAGEWSAYDLRILQARPDSGDPPDLELLARRKLGAVHSLALIPAPEGPGMWMAVGVADLYASRRVFPADAPGGTPGLYLFAWDGRELEQVGFFDLPWPARIFTGDFDGNGLSDLALAVRRLPQFETTIVWQTAPGRFEPLTITQLWPVGVVDRDHDGDDELLAIDADVNRDLEVPRGRLFVLGSGEQRLPPIVPVERARDRERPTIDAASVDESLAGSIARAEDLADIGLPLRASDKLRELAGVAPPRLAAQLSLRAAELFESRGHRLTAAELYARAAADPLLLGQRCGPARVRAMQLYAEVHRFAEAAFMAEAALESITAPAERAELEAELARLRALSRDDTKISFDFESPLDERWAIDPLAVRRRHGRLELQLGGPEQGVVARRELHWDGGRLALEVELDVSVVEWGSEVTVALVPVEGGRGEVPFEVGVTAWGGGGIYQLRLRCAADGIPEPGARNYPLAHPHAELADNLRRFVLSVELAPDIDRRFCRANSGLLGPVHVEAPIDGGLAPGRYELQIRGSGYPWSRATASIDRIAITGARDPDDLMRPIPRFGAHGRELAEGRAESVLDALERDTAGLLARQAALLRFLALDELGRWEPAELALADALELPRNRQANACRSSEHTRTLVGLLLRHRPERLGPALRRMCRTDDYFSILYEVWGTAAFQHPESDAIERLLTTQTAGLERWLPSSPADRLAALILLRQRAQAWSAQGADGAARAELERAVELGERWAAELDGDDDHLIRAQLEAQVGQCRTALAAELLDRGDEGRALDVLRTALERSPTPELLADVLSIDERFVRLRDRPLWRELVDPARAGRRLYNPVDGQAPP